jgi:hypothetical protein
MPPSVIHGGQTSTEATDRFPCHSFSDRALSTLAFRLGIGGLLVTLVLLAFRLWRTALALTAIMTGMLCAASKTLAHSDRVNPTTQDISQE